MDKIFYKKVDGDGSLNFIMIHNAGGNHKFFTHQLNVLRKKGNIILLDLPGHGSSMPVTNNSIDDSSEVILNITKRLALNNICLVGLNNGANIALHTFNRKILSIEQLILIDPPLFMTPKFIEEIRDFINKLDQNNYEEFIKSLVSDLFIKTCQDNEDIAFSAFMQADRKSLQAIFQSLINWDQGSQEILHAITCPTLCIITDEHHCLYQKVKDAAPDFHLGKTVGSKCWATLEVPEQVNAMIERFLVL